VILASSEEAQRAETALVAEGVAPRDVKLYAGKEILDNHEEHMKRRGAASKMVGSMTDDVEGRELYLGYAREDRSAMWVRIPDGDDVPKALRVLADHDYLHTRYYGAEQQTEFNVS
jgi:hypothetical protein